MKPYSLPHCKYCDEKPYCHNNIIILCHTILHIFYIEMDKTPLFTADMCHILSYCDEWNSDVVCEEKELGGKTIKKPFISYLFCKKRVSLMTVIIIPICCIWMLKFGGCWLNMEVYCSWNMCCWVNIKDFFFLGGWVLGVGWGEKCTTNGNLFHGLVPGVPWACYES